MAHLEPIVCTNKSNNLELHKMKIKTPFIAVIASLGFAFLAANCDNPLAYTEDAHGRGKTTIYIEESFKPLFETSIYTFEGLYPKADIVSKYTTENDVIKSFFDNKTKTICITRDFTPAEKKQLKKKQVEVRSIKIATDAVALIIHPDNLDSNLTVNQLVDILTGKISSWTSSQKPINVVFDNDQSANFNFMRELTDNKPFAKNVFAVKSNEEVMEYVKNNPSALGIIGVNWVSDKDDPEVMSFLKGMKIVNVGKSELSGYFSPLQGYMYTKEYPLTRDVWLINKGSRSGLNSGFVIFMEQEKGQLIIHKSALVPANTPIRMIQITEE